MKETIFDKIVSGEIPSYKVWENDDYLAFLTPYPNTPGVTVVIPKKNHGGYVFSLDNDVYDGLMHAARQVAKLLETAFQVKRVAMVFEGTGVAHVHAKLYPLHGDKANLTGALPKQTEFTEEYRSYLTTLEGPQMDDAQLKEIQRRIQSAAG